MDDEWQFLKGLLLNKKVADFDDIQHILDIRSDSACGENENFLGEVLRVKVYVELRTGVKKTLNVIVKKAPLENNLFVKVYKELKIFNAECNMYVNVLSGMEKMLKKFEEPTWKFWPDYYGHSDQDIFLQDLGTEGYRPYPKATALNLDEALLVFSSLGRMHGLSLSLVQTGSYDPSSMPPNIFIRKVPALKEVEVDACNNLAKAIEDDWDEKWNGFPERLRAFGETVGERVNRIWYETRGKLDVINHGDCWINNMLFKYDPSGNVQHMRFVDYQACHYNCYSWDLMQVMYSAILPKVRESYMDLFLSTYLENLKLSSVKTGYTGSLPTIEDIKTELDRLAPCSLVRSIVCYPIFLNPAALPGPKSKDSAASDDDMEEFGYKSSLYKSQYIKDILERTLKYFDERNIF